MISGYWRNPSCIRRRHKGSFFFKKGGFFRLCYCRGDVSSFFLFCSYYFYEAYQTFEELKREKSIPAKEKFYSSLTKKSIDNEAYSHVQRVWHSFRMKDLSQYLALYTQTDVVLLAEVMLAFRREMVS
jgi:hypothetical protein